MPVQKITLSAAVEEYISRRERTGFAPSTIVNERSNLGALVRHVERTRTIQVRHVTSDHLFDFFYIARSAQAPQGPARPGQGPQQMAPRA